MSPPRSTAGPPPGRTASRVLLLLVGLAGAGTAGYLFGSRPAPPVPDAAPAPPMPPVVWTTSPDAALVQPEATTEAPPEAVIPVELLVVDPELSGLHLEVQRSALVRPTSGDLARYTFHAVLWNDSAYRIDSAQTRMELLDAAGELVVADLLELGQDQAPMGRGDRWSSFQDLRATTEVRSARVRVRGWRGARQQAPLSSRPVTLAWKCPTEGLKVTFRERGESFARPWHRVSLEVTNEGPSPIQTLRLEHRLLGPDGSSLAVGTTYAVVGPALPSGQTWVVRSSALYFGEVPIAGYELAVVGAR